MNKKPTNYELLEKTMVTYRDLMTIPVAENGDLLQILKPKDIPNAYSPLLFDMEKLYGPQIIVRSTIAKKLAQAQRTLKENFPTYTLFVTYGFRTLEIQTKNFLTQLQLTSQNYFPDPVALYEEVHRYIAVPSVAGHPTGGAIDIVIKDLKTKQILDFGAKQYDFSSKDCYVFTNRIVDSAMENRLLLRKLLMDVGFAPFDGEWWHFSYGDKEWAYYYKKAAALYEQKPASTIKNVYNKGVI